MPIVNDLLTGNTQHAQRAKISGMPCVPNFLACLACQIFWHALHAKYSDMPGVP